MNLDQELLAKLSEARDAVENDEDGSIYLATVCSMLELLRLHKLFPHDPLVQDAMTTQDSLAKRGVTIRIW